MREQAYIEERKFNKNHSLKPLADKQTVSDVLVRTFKFFFFQKLSS